MAFTDFKAIAQVQEIFQLIYQEEDFIVYTDLKPSEVFRAELDFNRANIDVFSSEASRCENIIYPVLREVYKKYTDHYTLWSHKSIRYDDALTGTPDYLLATKSALGKTVLGKPILVAVEAKQNNFVEGWGQCLAELVAVQKLNADLDKMIYGIVTDGELWQFGRLWKNQFTKHKNSIAIGELGELFGAIGYLLQPSDK